MEGDEKYIWARKGRIRGGETEPKESWGSHKPEGEKGIPGNFRTKETRKNSKPKTGGDRPSTHHYRNMESESKVVAASSCGSPKRVMPGTAQKQKGEVSPKSRKSSGMRGERAKPKQA